MGCRVGVGDGDMMSDLITQSQERWIFGRIYEGGGGRLTMCLLARTGVVDFHQEELVGSHFAEPVPGFMSAALR